MPRQRKRKIPLKEVEPEKNKLLSKSIGKIIERAQMSETSHNKLQKELLEIYQNSEHEEFMHILICILSMTMKKTDDDIYAKNALKFICQFVTSFGDDIITSPSISTFKWLLSTEGSSPHIKFRVCQFINMMLVSLGQEAALDDFICDHILKFMCELLKDPAASVRAQAVYALQRLQNPESSDDIVVQCYLKHLKTDPAPKVRQAVVSVIGRNITTINDIQDRLWDVDENVRKHTYMQMTSYPVKAYRVVNRLVFLEQGLTDNSKGVRKIVTKLMLPQWLESYNKSYVGLIGGLKLDATDNEICRFLKTAKLTLLEIFKTEKIEDLIAELKFDTNKIDEHDDDYEEQIDDHGELQFQKCVQHKNLSLEMSIYWLTLIEYFQKHEPNELDLILPDLTTFCQYVQRFYESASEQMDSWQEMVFQHIIFNLIEIMLYFDLTDEIGKGNLKILIASMLKDCNLKEQSISRLVKIMENITADKEERFQFFINIINHLIKAGVSFEFISDRVIIKDILNKQSDKTIQIKISSLKVEIMELREQITNFNNVKNYKKSQEFTEKLNSSELEYCQLLEPLLKDLPDDERKTISFSAHKTPNQVTIRCLQMAFYMVSSVNVNSLTINACQLYNDFIRRHMESLHSLIRDWALRCGTAFSLLYESFVSDCFEILYKQFYANANKDIWTTSIRSVFELLDRYGFKHFGIEDRQNKIPTNRTGRQLYSGTEMDPDDDDSNSTNGVDLMSLMMHFLDTCAERNVANALIEGYCRLCLHGHYTLPDVVSKLLIKYFNPSTDNEGNQILGIFFQSLIQNRKQEHLVPAIIPVVYSILNAPLDNQLCFIKPEDVIKFVITSTQSKFCRTGSNIHDTIGLSFLEEMQNKTTNKDLLKILSKELLTLDVSKNTFTRDQMKNLIDKILETKGIDAKTVNNFNAFKDILDGKKTDTLSFSSSKLPLSVVNEEDVDPNIEEASTSEVDTIQNTETIPPEENKEADAEEHISQSKIITEENLNQTSQNIIDKIDSERELSCTPTTYGLNNSTNLKSLRRSLNSNSNSTPSSTPTLTKRIMPARSKKRHSQSNVEKMKDKIEKNKKVSPKDKGRKNKKVTEFMEVPATQENNEMGESNNRTALEIPESPESSARSKKRHSESNVEKMKDKIEKNKKVSPKDKGRKNKKVTEFMEVPATQENNEMDESNNRTAVEIPESPESSLFGSQDTLETIPSPQKAPRKSARQQKENEIIPPSPDILKTPIRSSMKKTKQISKSSSFETPINTTNKTRIRNHSLKVVITPINRQSPRKKNDLVTENEVVKDNTLKKTPRRTRNETSLNNTIPTSLENTTLMKLRINSEKLIKETTPKLTGTSTTIRKSKRTISPIKSLDSSFIYSPVRKQPKIIKSTNVIPIQNKTTSPAKIVTSKRKVDGINKKTTPIKTVTPKRNVDAISKTSTLKKVETPNKKIEAKKNKTTLTPKKVETPKRKIEVIKKAITKIPVNLNRETTRRMQYVKLKQLSSDELSKSLKAKSPIKKIQTKEISAMSVSSSTQPMTRRSSSKISTVVEEKISMRLKKKTFIPIPKKMKS